MASISTLKSAPDVRICGLYFYFFIRRDDSCASKVYIYMKIFEFCSFFFSTRQRKKTKNVFFPRAYKIRPTNARVYLEKE